MSIYTDNGSAKGFRTRVFRNGLNGGVEWQYAVDHANNDFRWYGYGMEPNLTISKLIASGMELAEYKQ